MIKLSSLKAKPNNPRKITDDALEKLAESIKRDPEFMRLRPMIVDGEGVVIGGNQRLKACRKLGMKEVPDDWVRKAEGLTDEQLRRFVLVDNAPAGMAGEWDVDLLMEEWGLSELEGLGFDMAAFTAELPDYATPESSSKEIDVDDYKMGCVCPKCGFEFDDKA